MHHSLATRLWPQAADSLLARTVLVLAGTLLLALSARVQVPFWPVPMTMQTFVVLGIGAAYGARLAGITLLTYLAQGAIGLPVFATGAGLAYMAGPDRRLPHRLPGRGDPRRRLGRPRLLP